MYRLLWFVASLALACPAVAADVLDRGSLGIGVFQSRISLQGRVQAQGRIDDQPRRLVEEFEIGRWRQMRSAELSWSPAERHELAFRHLRDAHDRTVTLSEQLELGGEVFPIDVDLRARTRFTSIELDYTWWAYATDVSAFGIQLGAMRIGVDFGLAGRIASEGNGEVDVDATVSERLYAPLVGLAGRRMFGDRLRGSIELRAIELRHRQIDGTALAGSLGLDWFVSDHWLLSGNYTDTRVRAEHARDIFDGRLELGLRGYQLLLKRRW